MTAPSVRFDDAPFNAFHARAVLFCGGSLFLDGYVLGVGGFALASWGPQVNLSSIWYGAIGSATLFGLFAGSLIFGRITDWFGRKLLFLVHLIALLLLSPVQLLVRARRWSSRSAACWAWRLAPTSPSPSRCWRSWSRSGGGACCCPTSTCSRSSVSPWPIP